MNSVYSEPAAGKKDETGRLDLNDQWHYLAKASQRNVDKAKTNQTKTKQNHPAATERNKFTNYTKTKKTGEMLEE